MLLLQKGNIAELLLKEGFAKCVDWSIAFMKSGADKLRAAEKEAKEKRLRIWKDYQSTTPTVSVFQPFLKIFLYLSNLCKLYE